jgi:hypothetical protein
VLVILNGQSRALINCSEMQAKNIAAINFERPGRIEARLDQFAAKCQRG